MALPPVVDHSTWRKEMDELRAREKAATRELDAIAAQRRRLPMVRMPDYTLVGAEGPVRLVDIFDGRSQLIVYNHMWNPDPDAEWQCGGCTSFTSSFTRLDFLANYDARFVIVAPSPIEDALAYAERVGNKMTWYSTGDSSFSDDVAPGGGFGVNVFLRDGEDVYRTWHTSGRGVEQLTYTFAMADVLPFGRQEQWLDSPEGWPRVPTYSPWLDSPDIARLYGPARSE
ncbi:MAG TPA: DUF899 family protein [Pseudonocardia sp.]|jgi:predicted dithiol-disulfide oxidoreductase (DUF899 family)|nr:DUF899 family protein [Pseudonocardia sp.]